MSLRRLIKFITAFTLSALFSIISFSVLTMATETVNPSLFAGKEYRLIGPWRGGRAAAVSGVIGD
ncbi:MAG: hypothetical protein P8H03_09500, partial [Emcibacteraceae bacterium]|nr:hypothetical protein [Emcibacteraceae bacterium]